MQNGRETTLRWETGLAGLFCIAAVAHLPALFNQHALDDAVILDNPAIASIRTLPAALASPWWYSTNHLYRPLTLASFAVERAIAGPSPMVQHAVNILLHATISVLLAVLLARVARPSAALIGASFFAVMPAHTEAIASVVGRAELLSALAMMLLMLLVSDTPIPTPGRRFCALLLSAAALASKEGGVVAPALAFAVAWSRPSQRPFAARWAASAATGTLALLTARLAVLGTFGGDLANPVFRNMALPDRLVTALTMLPRAARMLALPVPPALDYVPNIATLNHPSLWAVLAGVWIVVAVLVVMAHYVRRPAVAGLGVWIAALTIAPTANLFFASGVLLTGRTLYAPALGIAFLVTAAAMRIRATRYASACAATMAAAMLFAVTVSWRESKVWRSTDSVIAEMQRRHPDDYRSFLMLAYTARDHGHDRESLTQFRAAAIRFPGDPEMLTDAATVALRVRDTVTARAWLQQAVDVSPRAARGRTRLVSILLAQGDSAHARQLLEEGLRVEGNQHVWREQLHELEGDSP